MKRSYQDFVTNFKKTDSSLSEVEYKVLYIMDEAYPDALTEEEIVERLNKLNEHLNLN